jgi:hypothetical protein
LRAHVHVLNLTCTHPTHALACLLARSLLPCLLLRNMSGNKAMSTKNKVAFTRALEGYL